MEYVTRSVKNESNKSANETDPQKVPEHSGWSRPLERPVKLRDGANLATLADVRSYMFKRMQAHRKDPNWQRVTSLLLSAARSAEVDVTEVTIAVEMAASMDGAPARPGPIFRA